MKNTSMDRIILESDLQRAIIKWNTAYTYGLKCRREFRAVEKACSAFREFLKAKEPVFIIKDREYQQIYGDSFSFYPVRESKIDLLDPEADIVGLIEA